MLGPVVILALAALAADIAAAERPVAIPSITVVGTGTATARPDTAEVSLGVLTQAASAGHALAANSTVVDRLLKAILALGIGERDVQTVGLSVAPQYSGGVPAKQPPDIVGYQVSNQVRITVRDLALLGRLLDEQVAQGANTVHGIRFSVRDPTGVLDEAREKAMADARRKAELYAKATGTKLGRVLLVQETAAVGPRPVFAEAVRAAATVPVAPGESEFQATITVTYAIDPSP